MRRFGGDIERVLVKLKSRCTDLDEAAFLMQNRRPTMDCVYVLFRVTLILW